MSTPAAAEELQYEVEMLQKRLKRRNNLLDEIRRAYMKDVITVARQMEKLEGADPSVAASLAALPSLDMRKTLTMFAPNECTWRIAHGSSELDKVGGHIEVVHRESQRVVELTRLVEELRELEQEARLSSVHATLRAEKDRAALDEQVARNEQDRNILSEEILKLKARLEGVNEHALGNAQKTIAQLAAELEAMRASSGSTKELEARLQELETSNKHLSSSLENKEKILASLEADKQRALDSLAGAKGDIARMASELEAGAETTTELHGTVTRLERDLKYAEEKCTRMQGLLDEARQTEAKLKRQLSEDAAVFQETLENEQRSSEEIQNQADEVREKGRLAALESRALAKKSQDLILNQNALLKAAKLEVEQSIRAETDLKERELQSAVERLTEKSNRVEAKMLAETEQRMDLELQLRKINAEKQREETLKMLKKQQLVASAGGELAEGEDADAAAARMLEELNVANDALTARLADAEKKVANLQKQLEKYQSKSKKLAMTKTMGMFRAASANAAAEKTAAAAQAAADAAGDAVAAQAAKAGEAAESAEALHARVVELEEEVNNLEIGAEIADDEHRRLEEELAEAKAASEGGRAAARKLTAEWTAKLAKAEADAAGALEARTAELEAKCGAEAAKAARAQDVVESLTAEMAGLHARLKFSEEKNNELLTKLGEASDAADALRVSAELADMPQTSAADAMMANVASAAAAFKSHKRGAADGHDDDDDRDGGGGGSALSTQLLATSASACAEWHDRLSQLGCPKLVFKCHDQDVLAFQPKLKLPRAVKLAETMTLIDDGMAEPLMGCVSFSLNCAIEEMIAEVKRARTELAKAAENDPEATAKARELELELNMVKETAKADAETAAEAQGMLKDALAQREAAASELQQENATLKGLMFAAEEIKRQFAELNRKHQELNIEMMTAIDERAKAKNERDNAQNERDIANKMRAKAEAALELKANENAFLISRLAELEGKLASALSAYKEMVDKEKERLASNVDVGSQSVAPTTEMSIQTEFKTPEMSLRQVNTASQLPGRRLGQNAVVTASVVNWKDTSTLLKYLVPADEATHEPRRLASRGTTGRFPMLNEPHMPQLATLNRGIGATAVPPQAWATQHTPAGWQPARDTRRPQTTVPVSSKVRHSASTGFLL